MAMVSDAVANLFFESASGGLQAQFYSATACAMVEKELAEAQVCYKTTIVKSKKRGLVYVLSLLEPFEPVEPARGSGD